MSWPGDKKGHALAALKAWKTKRAAKKAKAAK